MTVVPTTDDQKAAVEEYSHHHYDAKTAATVAEYEDYTHTSEMYDTGRHPVAVPILLEGLKEAATRLGKKVSDLTVLDAGCGTGNYIPPLYTEVKELKGLEFNAGMLSKAQAKVSRIGAKNVTLTQGSILELPFEDNSMDAVLMNQMLHHLEDETTLADRVNVRRALKEVHRVLRPGGLMWVNTTDPEHVVDSFWWAELIPEAMARVKPRFPEVSFFESNATQLGMTGFRIVRDPTPLVTPDLYWQVDGPLQAAWRALDSMWSLATADELEKGLNQLREIIDAGKSKEHLAQRRTLQEQWGQHMSVLCYKA